MKRRPILRYLKQRGQALVLGLVFMFAGCLGLYFLFNTGQVSATKQKLTNSTDAAAYSAALWRARVLNFHAYSNRAIVAQEVAVAQAITLVSWSKYFETAATNIADYSSWFPPAWFMQYVAQAAQYNADLAEQAAEIEIKARAASDYGYKELLQKSQEILNLTVGVFGMGAVANEVIKANDSSYFAFALPDQNLISDFTRRYESDADRQRLKDIVNASLDDFVKDRSAALSILPPGSCIPTNLQQIASRFIKRGGTTMGASLDRWEAVDTLSTHIWKPKSWYNPSCGKEPELLPLGYGAAESSESNTAGTVQNNPGSSTSFNPGATSSSTSDMMSDDGYGGITKVRELNYEGLSNSRFPTSSVAVLARKEKATLHTSAQLGVGVGRLALNENLAGNRIWALSAAEVYFASPNDSGTNVEYASLYSPYWQVRLVEPSLTQRLVAEGYVN
jgi:Putative Flp pilus-assembly TadE/G-like